MKFISFWWGLKHQVEMKSEKNIGEFNEPLDIRIRLVSIGAELKQQECCRTLSCRFVEFKQETGQQATQTMSI